LEGLCGQLPRGYHIPIAHPGLFKEIDYNQYLVEPERYYSKQYAPIRAKDDSLYRRNLDEGASAQALYHWLFPNLMLNIYPDNVQINIILPLDPSAPSLSLNGICAMSTAQG
jgi:choline monooxygenase